MYPVLLRLGDVSLYTYGLFVAMGFLAGIWVAKQEARRLGENPERITDLCFFLLIFSILGARLFYVLTAPKTFLGNPLEIFRIWNGGLVFYGGFLGALATIAVYFRRHRMPLWRTLDILAPGVAVGHALGRVGCFFAGCCYGLACELPWAVTFTHPESLAPTHMPLHPTQLYSAGANLLIFLFLWSIRRKKRFHGQIFWLYVGIYGIARFIIEFFRGDFRGDPLFGVLSISQAIGVVFVLLAAGMLAYFRNRGPDQGPPGVGPSARKS